MQITAVAVMCHTLGAITPQSVDTLPDSVRREIIVIKDEMPIAGLHALAAGPRGLERAVDLPRGSMVDQPHQMRAGRLCAEGTRLCA
jgi:hypothetical protein